MSTGYFTTVLLCLVLLFTSCGDDAVVNTVDTIPPAAIADLHANCPAEGSIALVWTAPGDDSLIGTASQYAIRLANQPITLDTWDSASLLTGVPRPKESGRIDAFTITGLMPDHLFFVALRTADEAGNWSGLSNRAEAYSTPDFDPQPPAMITDLSIVDSTESSISLSWTAVGDDSIFGRATRYEVRYDTTALDSISWSTAAAVSGVPLPSLPGIAENLTVGELDDSTVYYFGIKAIDDLGKSGRLSNVVYAITLSDTAPPNAVTDLRVTDSTYTSVALTWTAPGDDGSEGTAHLYSLRYSLSPIDEVTWAAATEVDDIPAPQASGGLETFTITGLGGDTTYYFAIRVADNRMNWSPISDVVTHYVPNPAVWEKNIGGSGTDVANAVAIAADGNIVIAGKTNSSGAGDYDGYVVKIDTDGVVMWEMTFGGLAEDVFNDIVATSDGGFAATGFTKSAGAGGSDGWLVKLNSTGSQVWEKTCGSDGFDSFGYVLQANDGGFFLAGNSGSSVIVVKTDAAGVGQWDSAYYRPEECEFYPHQTTCNGAVKLADGSIVIAWTPIYGKRSTNNCDPVRDCVLTKFDSEQGEIWTESYYFLDGWASGSLVPTSSGGVACAVSIHGYGRTRLLTGINGDGQVIWESPTSVWVGLPMGSSLLADGSILVVGIPGSGGPAQAWLGLMSSSGELTDQFLLGGDDREEFHGAAQLPDGSIIAVGYTDSFSDSRDIYIVKIRP